MYPQLPLDKNMSFLSVEDFFIVLLSSGVLDERSTNDPYSQAA
jgi:hypothetical protein